MAKVADRYFKVDPWKIIEEGFNPDYSMVSESIFSLGNEYMGVRGYFEEGFGKDTLLGSYFNGVYEREKANTQGYKGIVQETEFMVNSVDWLYTRIEAAGEKLDLANVRFSDFIRELNMKTGLLTRSFIWETDQGKIKVTFERLLSMTRMEEGSVKVSLKSIDFGGEIKVTSGLNFDTVHGGSKKLWSFEESVANDGYCRVSASTKTTGMQVKSICSFAGSILEVAEQNINEKPSCVSVSFAFIAEAGKSYELEKNVINVTPLSKILEEGSNIETVLSKVSFEKIRQDNEAWWNEVWEKSDIEIKDDEENQQGIRFCIFQMFQTYHGAVAGTNIGAKGLTGEAYNGNAFWDTETYCLPFFIFHDKEAARNLLYFRYATLNEARKRAESLDCKGAFYPIATIGGRECCSLWQHASLQLQASTAVAYGIWMYEKITKDTSFTEEYGLEMLIEISRMLATRGDYNADKTAYGFYCVMGPDEFQMMVNNNCYTNYMAKFTLEYTLTVIDRMKMECPEELENVLESVGYSPEEGADWKEKAAAMLIPMDEKKELFEQHQGYFQLPHVDVDAIPISDFPLYSHWTYDRIYRNDMIKQPDVLMFMLMFNTKFTDEQLRKNYEYYEPRCIHESSLSPSVHSILASQLKKKAESYEFFQFATRMDLDNYNRNSCEGLHTTSIAAAWMNIVYGFGGLRSDGEMLMLSPSIPDSFGGYKFRIVVDDKVLNIDVSKETVSLRVAGEGTVSLLLYGKEVVADSNEKSFKLEK